jgi:hypothetical protein
MENREYINPFRDVHRKAKALKERAQEELKKDEDVRKKRQIQEIKSSFESKRSF